MSKRLSKPDSRTKPKPQATTRKPAGKAKHVEKSAPSRRPTTAPAKSTAPAKGKTAKPKSAAPKSAAPKPAVPKAVTKARPSKTAPAKGAAPKPTPAPKASAPKSAAPKSGPAPERRPRPVSESSSRKRALHLPEVPSDRPGPRMEQVLQAEIQPWKRDSLSDEEAQLRELKSIPTRNMYDTEEARRRLIGRPPTSGKRRLTKTKTTSSSNAS